jgi:thiol-disulfide isomerase/thioredoxin
MEPHLVGSRGDGKMIETVAQRSHRTTGSFRSAIFAFGCLSCLALCFTGCDDAPPIPDDVPLPMDEVKEKEPRVARESSSTDRLGDKTSSGSKETNSETNSPASPDDPAPPETTEAVAANENPFQARYDIPDFPKDMEWLNSGPLSKKDLKGKFVLLDFWTYCCINCMHILPELKKLEHEFPNELVVIGVHSAKFEGEKLTANIREAILRYEIEHPVVNDAEQEIWTGMGINSWPTAILLDPEGKAVWGRSGEFKATEVSEKLKKAIPYYRTAKLLTSEPLKFPLEANKTQDTPLRFPGKVLADEKSNRLFIADSNHNRIVVSTLEGQLLDVIGNGAIGLKDGTFKEARFNHPQGMALQGETLYVCDTENHALRKIDLKEAKVVTISGDGEQASNAFPGFERGSLVEQPNNRFVGKPKETQLNSPWDLWIHGEQLYIAMAGPHQIWKMPLDESEIGPFAGNGREDIVDGELLPNFPYQPGYSSFAQPSGLSSDGQSLFVADSEGSSIRAVPFDPSKQVTTVVGTSELPGGRLFYFGDRDGSRDKVKLQHCLAVAYLDGKIFVADTYNNKIKITDAKSGDTETFVGSGVAGLDDKIPSFDEPAGLSVAAGKLFVADTNNHAIRVVDLKTKQVSTLSIGGLTPLAAKKAESKPDFSEAPVVKLNPVVAKAVDGLVTLEVTIELPSGWKANPLGKPVYYLDSPLTSGAIDRARFGRTKLGEAGLTWKISLPVSAEGDDEIHVSTNYFRCQTADEGVCKIGAVVFQIPLKISATGEEKTIPLFYKVPE